MKNIAFFPILLLLVFANTACKKKPIVEETYWDKVRANQKQCIDGFHLSLKCCGVAPNSTSYFSANVAGTDLCFEENKDDYMRFVETGLFSIANGTVFNSTNANNLLMFGITPKSYPSESLVRFEVRLVTKEPLSIEQMLDKYLRIGTLQMFDDSLKSGNFGSDGFFLNLVHTCTPLYKEESTWTIIEGTGYHTNPESKIRCDAFTKTIGQTSITYDMTFSFEFQLSEFVFEKKWLRNGKFRTQLEIPR